VKRCPVLLTSSGQRGVSMKWVREWRCHKEKPRLARGEQHDRIHRSPAEPHQFLDMPVRRHLHHRDARCCSELPLRWTARSVGIHHATYLCFRVPSASGMALAPPSSVQDDSLSSAPSATNLKTAGGVSEITPRKRGSCLTACVVTLRFMASLNWLLLRVGSDRVASASAKAPDSGERPWASAARAPGAEQVTCLREQASPVTSRTHRGCRATLWIYFRRTRT
jgi:hypothetical protein